MRGVYVVSGACTSVSTSRTLAYLTSASANIVEIISISATDANVTTAEQLDFAFGVISSLGTPTGTSVTPRKQEAGDQAATTVSKINITASEPTYTGAPYNDTQGVPNVAGYYWEPGVEGRLIMAPSTSYGLRLLTSVANTYTFDLKIVFREIG